LRRRPASWRIGAARGAACDRSDGGKDNVTIATDAAAAVSAQRFRNLKCGTRIQRGFTYRGSDNFKIILRLAVIESRSLRSSPGICARVVLFLVPENAAEFSMLLSEKFKRGFVAATQF
jgi:hypothetical protein